MDVLITYDLVEGKQTEVKDAMKKKGYHQTIVANTGNGNQETVNLPNTTLWKSTTSTEQAIDDLKSAIAACNTKLERAFATPIGTDWFAVLGIPYKS